MELISYGVVGVNGVLIRGREEKRENDVGRRPAADAPSAFGEQIGMNHPGIPGDPKP